MAGLLGRNFLRRFEGIVFILSSGRRYVRTVLRLTAQELLLLVIGFNFVQEDFLHLRDHHLL